MTESATLVIDIGGTGIKMLSISKAGEALGERDRERTPRPATPRAVLACIQGMLRRQAPFERVSVGFPGVVVSGTVRTAPNLDTEAWSSFDLQARLVEMCACPVRVLNDADLQGYGVIQGEGVELVLTLGTGLGAALYSDGRLVPNFELGHHPFGNGSTYEERVCNNERKRIGKVRFQKRVRRMLEQLAPILNFRWLYLGGGNAKRLLFDDFAANVRFFENVEGMRGGIRLWQAPSE
jgi:polyphosphate glucokinase